MWQVSYPKQEICHELVALLGIASERGSAGPDYNVG
jgi:hypothetical protein